MEAGPGSGSACELKAVSGSALESKFKNFGGSKQSLEGPWTLTMEALRLKIEPWRVYRPVVADSHNFEEDLDHKVRELNFRNKFSGFRGRMSIRMA